MKALFLALFILIGINAEARDPSQVRAFRKLNPCPSTNLTSGACPGWVVDHMIPLCAGGPDHLSNMAWQERQQSYRKDKLERELCRRISRCTKWN